MTTIEVTPESQLFEIIDAKGRKIGLKRPPFLANYKLVEAIGNSAENRVYLAMCMPVLYLDSIDGDKILLPTSKGQLEALIQRLDEYGMNALNDGIAKYFSPDNQEEEIRSAKKSVKTPS